MASARAARQQSKRVVERELAANPCGECQVCCFLNPVPELQKPEGIGCEHLRDTGGHGCARYSKRPDSCKNYFCAYRFGVLGRDVKLRPDNIGLIFDVVENAPRGLLVLQVREAVPGAIEKNLRRLQDLCAEFGHVLVLVQGERRRYMGPEVHVQAFQQHLQRQLPVVLT